MLTTDGANLDEGSHEEARIVLSRSGLHPVDSLTAFPSRSIWSLFEQYPTHTIEACISKSCMATSTTVWLVRDESTVPFSRVSESKPSEILSKELISSCINTPLLPHTPLGSSSLSSCSYRILARARVWYVFATVAPLVFGSFTVNSG